MKKYWKSIEELQERQETEQLQKSSGPGPESETVSEEQKPDILKGNRRDFLKMFGFTVASAAIASSCEQPVRKAIPFLIQPENLVPGQASYYASTFFDGTDYCSVLVKVRDGRPIKIEGNTLSSVTKGGTNARTQGSVLSLYDDARHKEPTIKGALASWEEIDTQITNRLNEINSRNGKVVILSSTIISPSTKAAIAEFTSSYPGAEHIQYDVVSASGILKANEITFGKAFIPSYHFEKASMIVSFDADFLGTWLSPIEFTKQYVTNRRLTNGEKTLSRHIHFEAGMSLTGSNADERYMIRPSQEILIVANLYNKLKALTGFSSVELPESPVDLEPLVAELMANRSRSLVLSGSNDSRVQLIVNGINELLGNYGTTINTEVHLKLRQGMDSEMVRLVDEMNREEVSGIVLYDVNPAYDYPEREKFISGLEKVGLTIAMPSLREETSALTEFVCPDHHYLESWGDAEIKTGSYSLMQPAIRPIFNTRAAQESILKWAGKPADFRNFIQYNWEKNIFPYSDGILTFYDFWNQKLHDGVFEVVQVEASSGFSSEPVDALLSQIEFATDENATDLSLWFNVGIGCGKHANNPWLQELPDPVTKACWGNYASISPRLAKELDLKDDQLITINGSMTLPVLIQPGQEYKTISVALGYGREKAGVPAEGVGVNAYPFVQTQNGERNYLLTGIQIETATGKSTIARTQSHHSMEGRALVRETTLSEYLENPNSGNEMREVVKKHLKTMYPAPKFEGFHWGMAVDLNTCIGCNACVVACSAENNVPVVGKEQVIKSREMHWIRIDRYYKGDPDNPEVLRQPVMCQHCDNAPCENVCPVAATTHSDEGLNQMAYNRCIGTRYCNNNCPFKVRRFNFYDYTGADALVGNRKDPAGMSTDLRRLVLNPDVVVRAKGVIEKCSFCVQRIQEKKLDAKSENRQLKDGEVVPACAQACPADAIVFGDRNDPESKISKYFSDERNYHLLEELHVLPSVGYLTKVKNKNAT
jgi:MoCo/4Fe-4S cofactor protein with predicted Tat translocation signal